MAGLDSFQELQPRSVATEVADSIRAAINSGTLAPGHHLVEREIAKSLGVSTIAVREAFGLLGKEGIVERIPRRGTFIAVLSRADLLDLTRVRIALESLVVELAINSWTPADRAEVQAIIDGMEAAVQAGNTQSLVDLDEQFHEVFWRIAGSPLLSELTANLRGRIHSFLAETHRRTAPDELHFATVELHQAWLDAVDSGDAEAARAEVRRQISVAHARLVGVLPRVDNDDPREGGGRPETGLSATRLRSLGAP